MNVPVLGPLKSHPGVPEWLVSEPIPVQLFGGTPLSFTLDGLEASDEEDVERAVRAFLDLKFEQRALHARHVFANYRSTVDAVGEANVVCEIQQSSAVWAHVHLSEIFVSRRSREDRLIYV